MLKNRYINIIIVILIVVSFSKTMAQNYLSSPYSRFGIGDIMPRTAATTIAMGGVAYAFQSETTVNFANPASYVAYDSLSCLVDAAFSFKTHTLHSGGNSQKGATAYIDYISIGLPICRWWRTSIGYQPFSNMTYEVEARDTLGLLGAYSNSFIGDGGINEIYWGNAFKLFKGFSIGVNVSYIFGKYAKSRYVVFEDPMAINSIIENANVVKGVYLTAGAQYFVSIKDKYRIGIGAIYTPSLKLWNKQQGLITTYLGTIDDTPTLLDSLYYEGLKNIDHKLPQVVGAGLSFGKINQYFFEADFTWTNWNKYTLGGQTDSILTDAYKIAIGGNVTPNRNSSKYIARMTYSFGFNYELSRLCIGNQQIKNFSINIGVTFPVKKSKTGLGVVFEYGQIGTTDNNLIKENYFSATLNVKLYEKWYQKLKLE